MRQRIKMAALEEGITTRAYMMRFITQHLNERSQKPQT
jgi:hypothetical protein